MQTSPNPQQDMGLPPAPEAHAQPQADALLQELDTHLNNLPPEQQKMFEDGFKEYEKLPEVLGLLMPEAYDYFKTIQRALTQQNSTEPAPAGQGQPVNTAPPLMAGSGSPQPAKATSFRGMNP